MFKHTHTPTHTVTDTDFRFPIVTGMVFYNAWKLCHRWCTASHIPITQRNASKNGIRHAISSMVAILAPTMLTPCVSYQRGNQRPPRTRHNCQTKMFNHKVFVYCTRNECHERQSIVDWYCPINCGRIYHPQREYTHTYCWRPPNMLSSVSDIPSSGSVFVRCGIFFVKICTE